MQEAARGISPSSTFFLKDVEVANRILTTCEEFFQKLCRTCFSHFALFSVPAMCTLCRSSIMYSGDTWFTLKHDHLLVPEP